MKLNTAMAVALQKAGLCSITEEQQPVQKTKNVPAKQYKYRNYPCSIVSDDKLWYVEGIDACGGSGVLEWCYDEEDAKVILAKMKQYPQFSQLAACPFSSEIRMNHLVKAML